MKKVLIVYGVLVLVILTVVILRIRGVNLLPNFGENNGPAVTINEQTFTVEIADTDEKRVQGLSNRESLERDRGMLFIFEEKSQYGFWMRNVSFPLDIIYISDNQIVDIIKNAEPQPNDATDIPVFTPRENANYVLEINGGLADEHGFEIGNEVVFSGIN